MGNLFVELANTNDEFSGIARFMDDRFGLVIYAIEGKFDGTNIEFSGKATQSPEGIANGIVSAKGILTPEGQLRGQWSSTIGTGGTFVLHPHDSNPEVQNTSGILPERMHTATRALGALRLYAEDLQELIAALSKDFSQGRVTVTYRQHGNEISRYAADFQKDLFQLGQLRYLKLYIQEPEAYGINRFAMIELNAAGTNEIRVQGVQEAWVIGKAETLASLLKPHQKLLATTIRTFGINIIGLVFLATLVVMPELTLARRAMFIAVVVFLAWLAGQIHARLIPSVMVFLSPKKPSALQRAWPQLLSWFIAATSALFAAVVYGVLRGEIAIPAILRGLIPL